MFHKDDYELVALQAGHCPYCRNRSLMCVCCQMFHKDDYELVAL